MSEQQENGTVQPPTMDILVKWNHEAQQVVGVSFKPSEFNRLEFVIAVLDMAKDVVQERLRQWRMQQLVAQQQAAAEQAHLEQMLKKGKLLQA